MGDRRLAEIVLENVTKVFRDGTRAVSSLNLKVADGELMVLVGPSGCGKTTALRMVAGLEDVTEGTVRIGDRIVNDRSPGERDVAMVFQNYALYPHLTVYQNIALSLRIRHVPRNEMNQRVTEAARILGIEELLKRRPKELSGGQRQRVAMGRAIVRHPRAFLMDEPLSNLDAKLRIQMRVELVRLHRRLGVTTVYVTHDQTEAMTLGQRVAVLNQGRIQQVAPPRQLYQHPQNVFVASFIGSPPMNFFRGRLADGGIDLGPLRLALPAPLRQRITGSGDRVLVGPRPEGFVVLPGAAASPGALVAEIEVSEEMGAETFVYLRAAGLDVVAFGEPPLGLAGVLCARIDGTLDVRAGDRVTLEVRPE